MSNILLDTLKKQPLICAEGYLFEMERRGYLTSGEFVPEVALEHPEVLENLHREFQHAGSNIVQAFTYNGHREKMRVIDKEHLLEPLNRAALRIARKCADNPPKGLGVSLMAGNISNSNIWEENNPRVQAEVKSMFAEMVQWAKEERADFIIGETFYYAEEAFAALEEIKKSGLPSVITISPMGENKMRDGYTILETCKKLEELGADVVIDHREEEDLVEKVREITSNQGVDVAYDPVGGETFQKVRRCMAWNGRLLVIGFVAGIPELATNHVLLKNYSVVGVHWGASLGRDPSSFKRQMSSVLELAKTGEAPQIIFASRTHAQLRHCMA